MMPKHRCNWLAERLVRHVFLLVLALTMVADPASVDANWRLSAASQAKARQKTASKSKTKTKKPSKTAKSKSAEQTAKPAEDTSDPVKAELLMEAASGLVIVENNADTAYAPASMVKMMTVYIVMEEIANGRLSLDTPVTASARASKTGGSQVYLKEHEVFPVTELLDAILVHSANDACIALAEHIAGSVDAFVDRMNAKATELGLSKTQFGSVHGLPPSPGQTPDRSSARDMAMLGRALITRFPEVLERSKIQQMTFRDGKMVLDNTNKLLKTFPGTDGIKTGFCDEAGFCVTATAERDGMRFIAVVMGGRGSTVRFDAAARLLSQGFGQFERRRLAQTGQMVDVLVPIADGSIAEIRPVVSHDVFAVVERAKASEIILHVPTPTPLTAPVIRGTVCGQAFFQLDGHDLALVELIVPHDVPKRSLWQRVIGWLPGS